MKIFTARVYERLWILYCIIKQFFNIKRFCSIMGFDWRWKDEPGILKLTSRWKKNFPYCSPKPKPGILTPFIYIFIEDYDYITQKHYKKSRKRNVEVLVYCGDFFYYLVFYLIPYKILYRMLHTNFVQRLNYINSHK